MTAPTNEQIREAVSKEYADRVRGVLARAEEEIPLADASGCCSAPAPAAGTYSAAGYAERAAATGSAWA